MDATSVLVAIADCSCFEVPGGWCVLWGVLRHVAGPLKATIGGEAFIALGIV